MNCEHRIKYHVVARHGLATIITVVCFPVTDNTVVFPVELRWLYVRILPRSIYRQYSNTGYLAHIDGCMYKAGPLVSGLPQIFHVTSRGSVYWQSQPANLSGLVIDGGHRVYVRASRPIPGTTSLYRDGCSPGHGELRLYDSFM